MLQTNLMPYASDALEDAMRLAQTKALNSYSFSDCLSFLNYTWNDLYNRLIQEDSGYYSQTVRLTQRLTKLPPFVKNTIKIYSALDPVGYNRQLFVPSGMADLNGANTYYISGFDLYCPAAERQTVWLEYVPMQPQLFFTHHNRDPKIWDYEKIKEERIADFRLYKLLEEKQPDDSIKYFLEHKNKALDFKMDITDILYKEDYKLDYISCDYPYIFVSYKHIYTERYLSGFYPNIINSTEFIEYNPFDYTGRGSNVRYYQCKYNDKTGMGVIVQDFDDLFTEYNETKPRLKELGWTPDTLLMYPCPEMYRLLVARLADKLSAINESNPMGVAKELTEATYAFNAFCTKNKSSWFRIHNVTGTNITDYL